MSDAYYGEIRAFPYTYVPEDWMECDGRLLRSKDFQTLYSVIGNRFGGDGYREFALPDLRGRAPIGAGQQGGTGTYFNFAGMPGEAMVTLTNSGQIPQHTHTISALNVSEAKFPAAFKAAPTPNTSWPARFFTGTVAAEVYNPMAPASPETPTHPTKPVTMAGTMLAPAGTPSPLPHENRQPFFVLRYCIRVSNGEYPIRSE